MGCDECFLPSHWVSGGTVEGRVLGLSVWAGVQMFLWFPGSLTLPLVQHPSQAPPALHPGLGQVLSSLPQLLCAGV